jgi:ubiquinone/menaquinone biosynthesis C-methylase UbiE
MDWKNSKPFRSGGEAAHWEMNLGDSHEGIVERAVAAMDGASSILDAGCGYGRLECFLPPCMRVVGLDISSNALKQARSGSPSFEFVKADLNRPLKFDDKSFSYTACLEVLEHVKNPIGLLEELMRVGERSVISLPNGMWTELRPLKEEFLKSPNYYHPTEKMIRNVIRELGGKVVSFEYVVTGNAFRPVRNLLPRIFSTGFFIVIDNGGNP